MNIKNVSGDYLGEGGESPEQVARGQVFISCVRNAKEHKHFRIGDTRPGGSVTGVT